MLASVRLAPGKFLSAYANEADECGSPARHLILHLLDTHIRNHRADNTAVCLRGLVRHADGQLAAAVQDYTTFLWAEPRDAEVYLFRASAERNLENSYSAVLDARQAVQLDPKNGGAQRFLGLLLLEAKQCEQARLVLDKAIELNVDSGIDNWLRGIARAKLADRTGAIEDFSRLSNMGRALAEFGHCFSTMTRAADGDLDGALAEAEHAVVMHPCSKTFYHRAIIHGLRKETIESSIDFLNSMSLVIGTGRPANLSGQFSMQYKFGPDDLLSAKQRSLISLNKAVVSMLIGRRDAAAFYFNVAAEPNRDWSFHQTKTAVADSNWSPRHDAILALYYLTGGDYTLAIHEMRLAFDQSANSAIQHPFSVANDRATIKKSTTAAIPRYLKRDASLKRDADAENSPRYRVTPYASNLGR